MDKIIIYAPGIIYTSVCAANDVTVEEIEQHVNQEWPTGIASKWKKAEGNFRTGQPNPCLCDDYPEERQHFLLSC